MRGRRPTQAVPRPPPIAPARQSGRSGPRCRPTAVVFGCASTLATTGTAGFATSSPRSSGASLSSAGFISAQWNGALTASGTTRRAPSAFARSDARATAAFVPAMTTCPGALKFAGLDHIAVSGVVTGLFDRLPRRAQHSRHRALSHRNRFLHVLPAAPHDPDGIVERERAGDHVGGILAEAVPGDDVWLDARRFEQPRGCHAGGENRRLRVLGQRQPLLGTFEANRYSATRQARDPRPRTPPGWPARRRQGRGPSRLSASPALER